MQMFSETPTDAAWIEVLNGGSSLAFDVEGGQAVVRVHHSESGTAPAIDALYTKAIGNTVGWDYEISGLTAGTDRVWVRANNGSVTIVGIR